MCGRSLVSLRRVNIFREEGRKGIGRNQHEWKPKMRKLTRLMLAYLHLRGVGRRGWASLVHSDYSELILSAFLQVSHFSFQLVARYLHRFLPIRLVAVLLLDYVFLDGRTAIEVRSGPFQADGFVVVIGYLWRSRFVRLVCKLMDDG